MKLHVVHLACVTTLGLAAAYAAPAAAQTAPTDDRRGAYIGLQAGIAKTSDVDLSYYDVGGTFGGTGTTDTAAFRADVKSAFAVAGVVGYDFGMIRADVQVDYTRAKIDSLTLRSVNGAAVPASALTGACAYLELSPCTVSGSTIRGGNSKLRQASALANLWLDVPTGSVVTPYLGGGAGIGGYEVDGEGKARFAWQLGAGLAVSLSPAVKLTGDFRHRQIGGARIPDEQNSGTIVGKVKANTFTAGLRFGF